MLNNIASLLLCLISIMGMSKISSMLSYGCMLGWYKGMLAPFFLPPKWVFMVVWPTLYLMLGVAVWLVWQQRERVNINGSMVIFLAHMLVNFAWSPLTFCSKSVTVGLLLIIALIALAYLNYLSFKTIDPIAGQLMLPYFAWLSFAFLLSLSYFLLNYPHPLFNGFIKLLARG